MKTKFILILTFFFGLFIASYSQKISQDVFRNYTTFRQAVLNYKLPTTDLDRAKKNLDMKILKPLFYSLPPTPNMTFRNTMKIYNDRLYWAGQLQPIYITNPIGWYQFFKLKPFYKF